MVFLRIPLCLKINWLIWDPNRWAWCRSSVRLPRSKKMKKETNKINKRYTNPNISTSLQKGSTFPILMNESQFIKFISLKKLHFINWQPQMQPCAEEEIPEEIWEIQWPQKCSTTWLRSKALLVDRMQALGLLTRTDKCKIGASVKMVSEIYILCC